MVVNLLIYHLLFHYKENIIIKLIKIDFSIIDEFAIDNIQKAQGGHDSARTSLQESKNFLKRVFLIQYNVVNISTFCIKKIIFQNCEFIQYFKIVICFSSKFIKSS